MLGAEIRWAHIEAAREKKEYNQLPCLCNTNPNILNDTNIYYCKIFSSLLGYILYQELLGFGSHPPLSIFSHTLMFRKLPKTAFWICYRIKSYSWSRLIVYKWLGNDNMAMDGAWKQKIRGLSMLKNQIQSNNVEITLTKILLKTLKVTSRLNYWGVHCCDDNNIQ